MNLDHVFIDLAVTHPNPRIGQIIGVAAARTSHKGKLLVDFCSRVKLQTELTTDEKKHLDGQYVVEANDCSFADVIKDMRRAILNETRYEDNYVVIATGAENDRNYLRNYTEERPEVFGKRPWFDILHLAWPLCYHDHVSDRSFESLCKHFGVENPAPDTARGDCEALARVYWALMTRYKTALGGEEILREVGGEPLQKLRSFIGL